MIRTLEGCLKLARQAIGDSGQTQRLIQARRGYGYRFVGAVEVQAAGPTEAGCAAPEGTLAPSAVPTPAHAPVRPARGLPLGELVAALAGVGEAALELPTTGATEGER